MKFKLIIFLFLILIYYVQSGGHFQFNVGKNCTIDTVERDCGFFLVCRNFKCDYCRNTTECTELHSTLECKDAKDLSGQLRKTCQHKNLFPRFSIRDAGATILSFIGGMFASGTGIGGGGLFIPFFHMIGGMPTTLAIALAKAMIVGEASFTCYLEMRKKHPFADRPLINYEVASIFEPITLLGTVIGVYFNVMVPTWLLVIMLFSTLTWLSTRTFRKGLRMWRQETLEKQGKVSEEVHHQLLPEKDSLTEEERKELEEIIESEKSTPISRILLICFCWGLIMTTVILPNFLPIERCGLYYWLIICSSFPIMVAIVAITVIYSNRKYQRKRYLGYPFVKGDVHWTKKNSIAYPAWCFLAGWSSAMLGVGGGTMKAPLMLEMGMIPQIVTATSSFMVLSTSASSAVQYMVLGRLPWDYASFYFVVGLLASFFGHMVIEWAVKKSGRSSIIVLILASVIVASALCMVVMGTAEIIDDLQRGVYMGFNWPC